MRRALQCLVLLLAIASATVAVAGSATAPATSVLFIGNSFTYGDGSPVVSYRATTVTDLNRQGIGGVSPTRTMPARCPVAP